MKIAITGHRPEDLTNLDWVTGELTTMLEQFEPEQVFIGMAAGVDLLAGEICVVNNIPVIACKPWAGHKPRYNDVNLYTSIIRNAEQIVEVDPTVAYQGAWVYHKRNEYMVDRADTVIAVWNGKQTGGTASCVKYAMRKNKTIIQINPATMTTTMINSSYGLF